jgi:hypothetical protein
MPTIGTNSFPINSVAEIVCRRCRRARSRRRGLVVEIAGRSPFVCWACCRDLVEDTGGDHEANEYFPTLSRGGAA